jgi:hypothetical protein
VAKCSKWLVFSYRIEDFFLNFVTTFLALSPIALLVIPLT